MDEGGEERVRVFLDARLAARGLGIASATVRLLDGFAALGAGPSLHVNATGHGWTRRGQADTLLRSGLLDVSPRWDPRTRTADVVHYFGNTAPRFPSDRVVVTVHDLMMVRSRTRKARLYRELLLPGLARGDFPIVAISRQTADDVCAQLPSVTSRVQVIPHGWRPGRFHAGERRHVLMFGGSSDPRKRVGLGVAAYARYAERAGAAALPLVVAGRAGIDAAAVRSASGEVRVEPDPDDARVEELLSRAACLLYPTREEGYGLPIVEAGEVGTPVVLDAAARLPAEPMGTHVVAVQDASSLDAWAGALREAVRRVPVADALDALPTWPEVAQAYAALYDGVAR